MKGCMFLEQLTFSIIGCQHMHISIFIEEMLSLGHKCAGIYEKENMELLHSMAEKYELNIVEDIDLLLVSKVDIVGCATINNEKVDVIELCEQHGKHIMVDKPIVTNRKDFVRVKNVIDRGNIQVSMLLTERFRPSLDTLKQKLEQGDIGKIVSIEMRKPHRLKASERPKWHFSKEQGGGIVIDLFVHDFDLLKWLTGEDVKNISGYVSKNILPEYPRFYDVSSLQIVTDNGIICNLYADWYTPNESWTWGDCRLFVVGTKGTFELRLTGDPLISKDELLIRVTDEEAISLIKYNDIPQTITADFINRIQGKNSLVNHEDILSATKATLDADDQAHYINNLKSVDNGKDALMNE